MQPSLLNHGCFYFLSRLWLTIFCDEAAAQSLNTSIPRPPTIVSTNPGQLGNYTTRRLEYNLSEIYFNALLYFPSVLPEGVGNLTAYRGGYRDFPIEVLAEVTDPVEVTGKRHSFCCCMAPLPLVGTRYPFLSKRIVYQKVARLWSFVLVIKKIMLSRNPLAYCRDEFFDSGYVRIGGMNGYI
jgi:hypothetical protein